MSILATATSLSSLCLYSSHYSFLSFSLLLWNIVYTSKKKKSILTLWLSLANLLIRALSVSLHSLGLFRCHWVISLTHSFLHSSHRYLLSPVLWRYSAQCWGYQEPQYGCLTLELAGRRQKQEEMIPVPYQAMSAVKEEAWDTAEQHLSWLWRKESGKPLREEGTEWPYQVAKFK